MKYSNDNGVGGAASNKDTDASCSASFVAVVFTCLET